MRGGRLFQRRGALEVVFGTTTSIVARGACIAITRFEFDPQYLRKSRRASLAHFVISSFEFCKL